MSTIQPPAATENATRDGGATPLLFAFLIPLLAVVGLVLWIGASVTWLAVGVTLAAIACFTGLVMIPLSKLLADEEGSA